MLTVSTLDMAFSQKTLTLKQVEKSGFKFIGPKAKVIRTMGDKVLARLLK